ncbi:hypothetical protein [Silvanigrella aquatica]|uniref:hypothetical protein n=1 Tax=Silvanigrella aquatica TaxID=1915309 RepID=UPI000A44E3AD|nr:hypothetical protein [Silvanigrella aquatica]
MLKELIKNIYYSQKPFVTLFFIFVNIIFYLYTSTQNGFSLQKIIEGPSYDTLILFGAKENGLISMGQIHRFFFPFSCMLI